jgi:single-strand DNA-binding protein
MTSMNKAMLIGNLGKDPEKRVFENGGMLVRFPIATTESYTNKEGQKVTQTEWHNIVVGRKGLAEVCDKYLKKGQKIFIEGRIKTRQWEDNGITRYAQEIHADNMVMMSPAAGGMSPEHSSSQPASYEKSEATGASNNPAQPMADDADSPF